MKYIIISCILSFVSFATTIAKIPNELPITVLGEYQGEPENIRKESKARNPKILHYAENVIVIGPQKSIKWKMKDPHTSVKYNFAGNYGIIEEKDKSFTLSCTVSYKDKNTVSSMNFYLIVMKDGKEITFLETSKERSFTLKRK